MNIKINFIVLCLFVTLPVFANVFNNEYSLNYIVPKLPELNNTHCKFNQEKYIQSSNIRLKSSGEFSFEKDKGVTFYTTYPVKNTVSYANSEYKQINNIINAIAEKKYSKLEHEFKFYFEENKNGWSLGLKPKETSKTSKYISYIQISGKESINEIIIETTDKVETKINFSK